MACKLPRIVLGARNLRFALLFQERNLAGKLLAVDLTSAATPPGFVVAMFRKPSGEIVQATCTVDAPATSGVAFFLTSAEFLDEFGDWEVQGLAHLAGAPAIGRGFFPSFLERFVVEPLLRPFSPLELATPAASGVGLALPNAVVSVA